ncbi:MAG: alpha-amylase [Williamsia sp.]|nr:alpha-amylase [Williamsia sp.]
MYRPDLHQQMVQEIESTGIKPSEALPFYTRLASNLADIDALYKTLYGDPGSRHFSQLVRILAAAYKNRPRFLLEKDDAKAASGQWFLSNRLAGMSLYVDRFCGHLQQLPSKLDYFTDLGINLLHLMPLFQSPPGESDGGYAVSDYRQVDPRFGTLEDLQQVVQELNRKHMYLMLDIVLNHTSHRHEWAEKARAGDPAYQDFYYFYPDRQLPDQFEQSMPEIFPESAPGNFTYVPELNKWVMTVFHQYQWDLNFSYAPVLLATLENIFFYANLGVDILRIDAPAFIWKQPGTTSQNLPQAHMILQLIKLCVQVATPGMALLGEAIVGPRQIMEYFGRGRYAGYECDLAYNATHMALQWDALATGDTRVMLAAQHEILQKPLGTSWITYTRGHDDIGLGYDDAMIAQAGFAPYEHRRFLKEYYAGVYPASVATGALFSVNPKTQDARISGSLASLCGLEKAIKEEDAGAIDLAVRRILLMQAHCFFLGGIPMTFYGDEAGYTNDYSYLTDPGKHYDNRWMHRPVIDWEKNKRVKEGEGPHHLIYKGMQRLLALRSQLDVIADTNNLRWLHMHSKAIAAYLRSGSKEGLCALFNFSNEPVEVAFNLFDLYGFKSNTLYDHWQQNLVEANQEGMLNFQPYQFYLLRVQGEEG